MPDLPRTLKPGAIFEYTKLLIGKPKAESLSYTIVDPNQNNKEITCQNKGFKPTQIHAVLNTAVKNHIKLMKDDFAVTGNTQSINEN